MNILRRSGIDVVGDVPWGTHFCQFYETERDLTETLVPYFREGLSANEFCMWVTSEPLQAAAAAAALRKDVPDLDSRIARGQIEILDYSEWYTKDGGFQADRVLAGWVRKLEAALEHGYEGLRLTGNTFWLEPSHWNDFAKYEEAVNDVIGNYKMLAICTYSLEKCGATEIAEVIATHQFALLRRQGRMEVIQSGAFRKVEKALHETGERYRTLFDSMGEGCAIHEMIFDGDGKPRDYRFLDVNRAFENLTGLKREAIVGRTVRESIPDIEEQWIETYGKVVRTGERVKFENYAAPLGRHFEVSAYRPAPGRFVAIFSDVTARKKAEDALRRSYEELNRAQSVAHTGSWRLDSERNVLEWSDEAYRIFEMPKGTPLTYEIFLEAIHPEDREYVDRKWNEALHGAPYDIEHRIRAGNAVKWVRERAELVFDAKGGLQGGFGTVQDVTERKKAEHELRDNERGFKLLFEITTRLLKDEATPSVIDDISRQIMAHLDCQVFFHFAPEGPEGRLKAMSWAGVPDEKASLISPPEGNEQCFVAEDVLNCDNPSVQWAKALGLQAYCSRSIRVEERVAGSLCFGTRTRPRFSKKHLALMEHMAHEISVAIQRRLLTRRAADMALFPEQNPYPVLRITADAHVTYRNPACKSLPGWSCKVGALLQQPQRSLVALAMTTGRIVHEDVEFEGHAYSITVVPFPRDRYANVYGTDITARKQAEAALARSRDELEALVKDRTDDLTNTVRTLEGEMRQRLQFQNDLESANRLLTVRAQQLRALANMLSDVEHRERQRMARLLHDHVQQLLVSAKFRTAVFARMKDKTVKEAAKDIDKLLDESLVATRSLMVDLSPPILHEGNLVSSLEWIARWMGEKHGLTVDLNVHDDVPALSKDLIVFVFESVRELLFNVVKHAGVKTASVDLRAVKDGPLKLVVRDRGRGFDPEQERRSPELDGYGIFAIAERLGMRGGTLEVESRPGHGSRITLTIPVDTPSMETSTPPPGMPERRSTPRPASTSSGPRIRVLVADDHPAFRQGLAKLLQQEDDIEICGEAADGQEAVELAETLKPDVVLMDINMPKMNGIEATRLIHDRMPGVKIIGLSMHDEPESMEMMREAGAAVYLTKSSASSEIMQAVRACDGPHKAARAARRRSEKPTPR